VGTKQLLAIGGKEDKENECEILRTFVDLAGGADAEILLMTIVTRQVEETGSGSVIVVDGGPMTHTNLNDLEEHGEPLELHDLSLHVLPPGARFDLKKQRPIVNRRKRRAAA
jgi:cyanophycinase-like exopeptidase